MSTDECALSYYRIEPLGDGIRQHLRDVARPLHLTETVQLYMDGGASANAVTNHALKCRQDLSLIARSLNDLHDDR